MGVNFTVKEHQRLAYVDDLKGLTIIFVVFYHVIAHFFLLQMYPEMDYGFRKIIDVFSLTAMNMFVVLSGLVFAMAYCNENQVLEKNRFKRQVLNIIGVYVFFSLLWWGVKMYLPGYFMPYDVVSIQSIYSFLLVPLPLCHMWFMHMLLLVYLVAGIDCIRKLAIKYGYIVLIGMPIIVPVIFQHLTGDSWLAVRNLTFFIGFFTTGMFYYYHQDKIIFSPIAAAICFILSTLLFVLVENKTSWMNMLIAEGWSIGILVFFAKGFLHFSWLEYVGIKCLDIYIGHFFVVALICEALYSKWANYGIYIIIVATILCTILPLLFSYILKKIGLYTWLFKPGNAYLAKRR